MKSLTAQAAAKPKQRKPRRRDLQTEPLQPFQTPAKCGHPVTAYFRTVEEQEYEAAFFAKSDCPTCKRADAAGMAAIRAWRDATWPEDADTTPAPAVRKAA